MKDITSVAIIAGIALGISIALIILYLKNQQSLKAQTGQNEGITYIYDDQNRLQSIVPNNIHFTKLKAV